MHDGQLLKEFLTGRSQAAFRQLVERYQDVVHSLAWRQLGDGSAAEDVAQQVFLLLARKAHWLTGRSTIGGWLHRSTINFCARHQTREFRRMKREMTYSSDASLNGPDLPRDNRDMIRQLDSVLGDLPEKEREAIVLRYYRGQSLREVGESLGTTEEAARKRVSRALERLTEKLRRRGVTAAAAALLSAVLVEGSRAAPAGFSAKTTGAAAAAGAFGKAGVVATVVTHAALISKAQLAGILLLATGVPLGLQWQANRRLSEENARLSESKSAVVVSQVPRRAVEESVDEPSPMSVVRRSRADQAAGEPDGKPKHDWFSGRRRWEELDRTQKVEARVAEASTRLSLTAEQAGKLTEVLKNTAAEREKARRAARYSGTADNSTIVGLNRAEEEGIAGLLSEDQRPLWEQFVADERQNRVELHAMESLKEIQRVWRLNEDQKDAAWQLFTRQAEIFDPEQAMDEGMAPEVVFKEMRDQQDEALRKVLTPEQAGVFERHRAQQMALWDEISATRSMQGPPPGSGPVPGPRPNP